MLGIDDWWRRDEGEGSGDTKHGGVAAAVSGLSFGVGRLPQQWWSRVIMGFGFWRLVSEVRCWALRRLVAGGCWVPPVGVDFMGFGSSCVGQPEQN
nr:hypothetical protein CFP56_29221 [Quercus suber]